MNIQTLYLRNKILREWYSEMDVTERSGVLGNVVLNKLKECDAELRKFESAAVRRHTPSGNYQTMQNVLSFELQMSKGNDNVVKFVTFYFLAIAIAYLLLILSI
jgi:hypothetical protein